MESCPSSDDFLPDAMKIPFRTIQPRFFSGLFDDPLMLIPIRPLGRSLLVDCGQIHHLAKRVVKSLDAIFITHAHMDHFMGIDTVIRMVHVSPKTLELFGPEGLAGKLEHKLKGYNWNLAEDHWCSFRVREVHPEKIRTYFLSGPEGFSCRFEHEKPRQDRTIYRNRYLRMEAEICDHRIPVLIFRITENSTFLIDEEKVAGMNLVRGPWLKRLKKMFYAEELAEKPIAVPVRKEEGEEERTFPDAGVLYDRIRKERTPGSLGYVTDVGFSEENAKKLISLMHGVTVLACECAYLKEGLEKARSSFHLCTDDLNFLSRRIRPRYLLPMHLSKNYLSCSERLFEELNPPSGVTILRPEDYATPRPLLPCELPDFGDMLP